MFEGWELLACNYWDLVVVLASLQLEFSFFLIISYDPIEICHYIVIALTKQNQLLTHWSICEGH